MPVSSWTRGLFAGAALLLAASVSGGCGGDPTPTPSRSGDSAPVSVETVVVSLEEVPRRVAVTGTVEAWTRVSPGTKIMGRIDEVPVREGDRVRRGQLLARLEQRDLEASVEQARAGVRMAEASLENARAQHERMSELHGRGSVTPKNLEDATAGFRVAQASLEQARANLAAAEVTLSYAEIRSPLSGRVSSKRAEAGDMASPGMALFTVEDLSRVKVVLRVPESEVVGLSDGDPVEVTVDVLHETWNASVDRILPAGDPASRTYDVQLVLSNPDGRILSGMFVRATLPRGTRPALLVPSAAVVERGQLRGVFVVDPDGRARLRWVRLGRAAAGSVEVLSGLSGGERYIVSPPASLADGTPVEVR